MLLVISDETKDQLQILSGNSIKIDNILSLHCHKNNHHHLVLLYFWSSHELLNLQQVNFICTSLPVA